MQAIDELNLLLGIGPPRVKLPVTLQKSGYTAVRPIGKGGFGQAHLIFHAGQGKYFVAKHVNMAQMTSRQRKDAHNEIDMLQQLDHPNIIRYIEYVEEPPNLYIVMEYADGGDLYSHLKKVAVSGRLLTEEQVMSLFTQTALALKHMHDRRMLHRDIKAQNVFLTKAHVVKLGDFGISTVLNSTMAMAQTMCGTPCYFSPELCQGKPYNNKSDIWALGVLLYEMCTTGELPFEAPNVRKLMDCICNQEPRPISTDYSRELTDLVSVMLAKDPKLRPDINAVLRHPLVRRYIPAASEGVAPAALQPPPPPAPPVVVSSPAPQAPPVSAPARSPEHAPLGKPPRVAHHNHVAAPAPSRHDDHRDVLMAEPPSDAVVIRPHQHYNDTNAGTSYQPALLDAARRAASEESAAPSARGGAASSRHTIDDWRRLSDEERDKALQGGLVPQFIKTGGDSVLADDDNSGGEGAASDYFNDQFMATLDTAALIDEAPAPAVVRVNAPAAVEVPPQAAPTPSVLSPIQTNSRRVSQRVTVGGLRLTSDQRASLRRSAVRASCPDVVPVTSSADPTSATDATTTASSGDLPEDTCIGGNCLCGATVYAAWLSMAIGTFTCDCMACRRFSGSPHVEWIHFPDVPFSELLQHSPAAKTFVVVPKVVETYFCGECGSTIAMAHADVEGCVVARATLSDNSAQILVAATTPQKSRT